MYKRPINSEDIGAIFIDKDLKWILELIRAEEIDDDIIFTLMNVMNKQIVSYREIDAVTVLERLVSN